VSLQGLILFLTRKDIELIRRRLAEAQRLNRQLTMATKKPRRMTFKKSAGNVFAYIGFANPEREQLKAHFTLQIYKLTVR
jgi:hypothetical protein